MEVLKRFMFSVSFNAFKALSQRQGGFFLNDCEMGVMLGVRGGGSMGAIS